MGSAVNSNSRVFASISELGLIEGATKPVMRAASMWVDNVVPYDNGVVVVRGYIGWDTNINVQISLFVA
jgi:hypothetical protein